MLRRTRTYLRSTRILAVLAVAALAVLAAAAPAAAQVDTGSTDFTRYVALGDSLTHGFSNGGVVNSVQVNSYPALIARQVGTEFEQPLIGPPGIPGLLQLQSLVPTPVIVPRPGNGQPTNLTLPRPYNNLGVSGFDARDILETVSDNPLTDTVLRGLGTALQQALALQPTFATVWIGNNDVLGAATSGIVIDGVTLTTVGSFEADYRAIVGTLAGAGADLALATIPDVTVIPFVTTLPPVVINPDTGQPLLIGGQPVPLIGPQGPLGPNDRVLLSAPAAIAQGLGLPPALGGTGPLPDSAFLSAAEVATIRERVNAFNSIIRAVAGETGAALVDINAFLNEVAAEGFRVGGITYTTDFLSGGIFSYDGVHATPMGYAVTANFFIESINEHFGADIPPANLGPFVFGPAGAGGTDLGIGVAGTIFTPGAMELLRSGLRLPSPDELGSGGEGEEADEAPEPEPEEPASPGLRGITRIFTGGGP